LRWGGWGALTYCCCEEDCGERFILRETAAPAAGGQMGALRMRLLSDLAKRGRRGKIRIERCKLAAQYTELEYMVPQETMRENRSGGKSLGKPASRRGEPEEGIKDFF